uniref:Uncharacterized protein n=1 Tax=Marmota marmota marmota TaxID=9994 RepID=A0A8C5YW07_MARMA
MQPCSQVLEYEICGPWMLFNLFEPSVLICQMERMLIYFLGFTLETHISASPGQKLPSSGLRVLFISTPLVWISSVFTVIIDEETESAWVLGNTEISLLSPYFGSSKCGQELAQRHGVVKPLGEASRTLVRSVEPFQV